MNHAATSDGFRQIQRHDGIFQESVHDTYKAKGKLPEPTICPECDAVFHAGRWQWLKAPANAHREMCPACHRIHDQYPAGFLTLKGEYFVTHRDELMHLIHNIEKREKAEHPLKRIIDVKHIDNETLVTTTDIHLARGIGEALHHAYQGELQYHYNPEQNLLRVSWTH